jgi:hypothetical protein
MGSVTITTTMAATITAAAITAVAVAAGHKPSRVSLTIG